MTSAAKPSLLSDAEIRKVAFASAIGTTIEWYDFFIYGTAAALVNSICLVWLLATVTGRCTSYR